MFVQKYIGLLPKLATVQSKCKCHNAVQVVMVTIDKDRHSAVTRSNVWESGFYTCLHYHYYVEKFSIKGLLKFLIIILFICFREETSTMKSVIVVSISFLFLFFIKLIHITLTITLNLIS